MKHQLVNWKSVKCRSPLGREEKFPVPMMIDVRLRRTLLSRILAMPSQNPISLERAAQLLFEALGNAIKSGRIGHEPDNYHWYYTNFIDWISSQGYHIELTGEEFEAQAMSDSLA
jgi:hypothetical protein